MSECVSRVNVQEVAMTCVDTDEVISLIKEAIARVRD